MQLGGNARKAYSPASSISSQTASPPSPETSASQRPRRNSRTLPVPIPVPNLTKKSRGRRVPTVSNGGIWREHSRQGGEHAGARSFTCDVPGCGKCFARGEHLKRHVRSIHTNEKPHKCPHPGCDKEFSRHDNLGQHLKTHKGGR
ncbi:hypothetical protein CONPUDRAFT_45476 [Coniophora puteana RWD-64-598 SS2]|uniref:C2H2-type domain-containing protein n=1 Tax=Coniophora puteana (strain RWD-64-598) TaxID=741705 RepID=A0A5M3N7C2_CONPW|nr:uncharacterized protein CONPUDRAFT_45476 [Coniophora puteana RWD-64-598 SS2]EIW87216.1 hypothetical protein CONPUDRAFT_45476 [Coniophora puteana RWD-64-598 SS2]